MEVENIKITIREAPRQKGVITVYAYNNLLPRLNELSKETGNKQYEVLDEALDLYASAVKKIKSKNNGQKKS